MTTQQYLQALNAYPVPQSFILTAAAARGLDAEAEVTPAIVTARAFQLVYADLLLWLSSAPNVTQGGQSYTFDSWTRSTFKNKANAIYNRYGEAGSTDLPTFGYKGTRL